MGALATTTTMITVATSRSANEPLRLMELPAAPLGRQDVRVKVHAAAVNPVDWKMRAGGPLRFAHWFLGPSGPLVVGVGFAGEIVEAGPDADLAPGVRVVGGTDFSRRQRGSYATEVVVRADQCAVLPDSVSFKDAACLPVPGATALRAFEVASLTDIEPASDARVLVLGASGGVGLVTVQLVAAMGAKAVGVCSGRNTALVERLGAVAIDYTLGDALEAARAHGPFDLVVHAVGTALYPLPTCRALLSPRGVVALAVVRASDMPSALFRKSVASILGRPSRDNLAQLVASLERGDIETIIEACFPLEEAEKAHQVSKAGKVVGKLMLQPC